MAKRKKAPAPKRTVVVVGDTILVGTPGATTPSDWFLAKVLWADAADVLIEHRLTMGELNRQVIPVELIRAVGTIEQLSAFRRRCFEETKAIQRLVRARESALGSARDLLWRRLDEIGATVPNLSEKADG